MTGCTRDCKNCKNRFEFDVFGQQVGMCMTYEMIDDSETLKAAAGCKNYVYDDRDNGEEEYTPSATAGDYSPNCPWNAPGMSIHDFI